MAVLIGAVVLGIFLGRKVQREAAEKDTPPRSGHCRRCRRHPCLAWRRKRSEHRVTYRFKYDGKIYSRTVRTPVSIWRTLAPGADLPVRFVPSRPAINHPVAWSSTELPSWFPYLLAAMCTVPAFLLPIPVRREARLLAEGRPAPGRVTGFKKADKSIRVLYEFRLLNGTVVKGKVNRSKPPVEGTSLCVLYDPGESSTQCALPAVTRPPGKRTFTASKK